MPKKIVKGDLEMGNKKLKVLHVISGGDTGGAKASVITLLNGQKEIMDVHLLCFLEAEFSKEARGKGIHTLVYSQKSRIDLSVLKRIETLIEKESYDLVNCHGARANFIISSMKGRIKIPVITTIHSDFNHDFDNNIYKKIVFTALNKVSLKRLDGYVVCASQFKEDMINQGYKREEIFLAYNGLAPIDTDFDVDKEAFFREIGVPYKASFYYVGMAVRLHPVKGIDVMLKAAKLLKDKAPNVKILIAGGGEERYRREYMKFIEDNGLEDTVYLIGFVKDIFKFYKVIDINALTSHSEGISYSLLEGGRFKKPSIGTRVGGMLDIIDDGETGLLFEDNNFQELANKILSIYSNKSLSESLGTALHQKIENVFSDKAMARKYKEIYQQELGHKLPMREEIKGKKILVSGYYGYSNSGDDAILECICQGICKLSPENQITILSYKPDITKEEYGVDAVNKFVLGEIIKAIDDCEIFIMGGGTLLQDESSNRSLYYYLFLLWYAKLKKKKCMLYANGIGPIKGRINRRITKRIVNRLDLITLRENMSHKELLKLGIKRPVTYVTADPVFTLDTTSYHRDIDKLLIKEGVKTDKKFVAVLFRKWENQKVYLKKIASICDHIYENYGLNIVLVPMKHPADLSICQSIQQLMNNESVILEEKYDVKTLIEIIGRSEFVLSMRLHALLYAALKGIPMVGFSYSLKIKYYMKELEMPCIDDVRDFSEAEALEMIQTIIDDYDGIKENLRAQYEKLKGESERNNLYLNELIEHRI